jgi:flagellar biosynthetic protein FlhB
MAESAQERTEEPSARRLAEARRDGNIPRSADLTAACVLLVGMILLNTFGTDMMAGLKRVATLVLSGSLFAHPARVGPQDQIAALLAHAALTAAAPVVIGVGVVAMLATFGHVGFLITSKPLTPDFSKLNPISGLKNIVGARGFVRLAMSLAKVAFIGAIALAVIQHNLPFVLGLIELDVRPLIILAWGLIYHLGMVLALVLIFLAIFDYAFQRHQNRKELRMSKQEIKEEMKHMEVDPQVKQRRARVARQLAMQRLGQAIPGADVIVTNPTHFAVALKYDASTMAAPKVVAKGADYMALRIRQLALQHEVPIVERKALARGLYSAVEVGQQVPAEHFPAIAEILAYVYRLSGRKIA